MKISNNQKRNIPEMDPNSFSIITFKRKIAAFLRDNKPSLANEFTGQMALIFPLHAQEMVNITYSLLESRMKVLKIYDIIQFMKRSFFLSDQIGKGQYKIVEGVGAPWAKIKQ